MQACHAEFVNRSYNLFMRSFGEVRMGNIWGAAAFLVDTNLQKVQSQPFPQIHVALAVHRPHILVPPAATCCGNVSCSEQQSLAQPPVNLLQVELLDPPASNTFHGVLGPRGLGYLVLFQPEVRHRAQTLGNFASGCLEGRSKTPTEKGKRNVLCGSF